MDIKDSYLHSTQGVVKSIEVGDGKLTYRLADINNTPYSFDLNNSGIIPFIVGTQTAATNKWTGTSNAISELYDGLTIRYWLPYAGTSTKAILNLTLSDGSTTGEIPCFRTGTARISNLIGAGNCITLTYKSNVTIGSTTINEGWWMDAVWTGVRSVVTGTTNGTISVNTNGIIADVAVKGLGSAAYTSSTNYAVRKTLTNEDLNSVVTPGFYNAGGGNTVSNKPDGVAHFALEVLHGAGGSYYVLILYNQSYSNLVYRRHCINGEWSNWTKDTFHVVFQKHTSTNTGGYNGLVPAPSYTTTTTRFLREDGTWVVPTDNKVLQGVSSAAKFRCLLLGTTQYESTPSSPSEITGLAYITKNIYVDPSKATLYADTFVGNLTGNATTATSARYLTTLGASTDDTFATYVNNFITNKGVNTWRNSTGNAIGDVPNASTVLNVGSNNSRFFRLISLKSGNLYYQTPNSSNDGWNTRRTILDSVNTYITNGTITINGTSITPLTSHLSLANYVTLDGVQTITGAKTFTASTNVFKGEGAGMLTVNRNSTDPAWVKFMKDTTIVGYLGIRNDGTPTYGNSVGTSYVLLHSNNYSSYLPFLNSSSTHATNSSVIYAPTTAGTSGQVLTSSGGVPTWSNLSSLSVGSASNGVFYIEGTGTTAGTWLGAHEGISNYYKGLTIAYKIPIAGASTTTLKINNLEASPVIKYNNSNLTTHFSTGTVVILVYDGTNFKIFDYDSNTISDCYINTAADTAAKTAISSYYTLRAGNTFVCTVRYTNTAASALTLNINSTGAKPIYLNGTATSSTNYSLKAGKYLVYYDGTNYYFYDNGAKIPDTHGNADTVDNYHIINSGIYKYELTVSLETTSVWYVTIKLTHPWENSVSKLIFNPAYVVKGGSTEGSSTETVITLYTAKSWYALSTGYNENAISDIYLTSNGTTLTIYLKMLAPQSKGYCNLKSPFVIESMTASTTAPSGITFTHLNTLGFTNLIANKLGESTVGSSTNPIYLNEGTPTACNVDTIVTSGSANLITSGGVYTAINNVNTSLGNYVKKSGDTMTGDLTLYAASGDSPSLIFLRGSVTDGTIDYRHRVTAGRYKLELNRKNPTTWEEVLDIYPNTIRTPYTIKSTIATGTAPFIIDSTTVNTNLNADLLDGVHKEGLFTALTSTSSTNLSIIVGGTTKKIDDLYAKFIKGTYTKNGGCQFPEYIDSGIVRWNMTLFKSDYFTEIPVSGFCDWMMMDTYTGNDVPWVTMIGVLKAESTHAYIASGAKGSTNKWNVKTLLDSSNYSSLIKLPGYSIATSASAITETDTLNTALGKLEYKANSAYNWVTSITGTDTDGVINKWGEIVDFLNGISDTTLNDILGSYVTISTALTISGAKTFTASTNTFKGTEATLLTIDRNSPYPAWIRFMKNGVLLGYIGVTNDYKPAFLSGESEATHKILLHSGNYTSYKHAYTNLTGSTTTANQAIVSTGTANGWTLKTLGNRAFDNTAYLPLAGGTMTGLLVLGSNSYLKTIKWANTDYSSLATSEAFMGGSGDWVLRSTYADGTTADLRYNKTSLKIGGNIALHSGNYNLYSPKLDGTGATGTWGINISGSAATATKLATVRTIWGLSFDGTGNVDGKLTITSGGMQVTGTAYFGGGTTYYFGSAGSVNCYLLTSNNTATFKYKTILNNSSNPYITFKDTAASQEMGNIHYVTSYDSDNKKYKNGYFLLRLWSYTTGTTTKLNYYEDYSLPNVTTGLTSNSFYTILTTKNPGYIGTTKVQASSANQSLTGITNLTISATNSESYIKFSRAITDSDSFGLNYILAPTNGLLALGVGSNASNYITAIIDSTSVRPYTTSAKDLGTYSVRWKNVYSVLGNFSGQITSTVTTGTAPFVVNSNTRVTNLNAHYLEGYSLNLVTARSAIVREAFIDLLFDSVQNRNTGLVVETTDKYPSITTDTNNKITEINTDSIVWSEVSDSDISKYLYLFDHSRETSVELNATVTGIRYTFSSLSWRLLEHLFINRLYIASNIDYIVHVETIDTDNNATTVHKGVISWHYTEMSVIKVRLNNGNSKVRITLIKLNENASNVKIYQLGYYTTRGAGISGNNEGFTYRGKQNLTPIINNVWNLGSSSYKWKSVYATTFYGSLSGNATSASKVSNALTLQFNGTTNQTYDGSSAKTFNVNLKNAGSGLLHNDLTTTLNNFTEDSTDTGWKMVCSDYTSNGFILKSIRTNSKTPDWILGNYSAGIAFGGGDTKGLLSVAYNTPMIEFAGGNKYDVPTWWFKIKGTSGTSYNLNNFLTSRGYIGTTAVQASSAAQALSGITNITATGSYTSSSTTDTADRAVRVQNKNGYVGIRVATNRGLYDYTKGNWIIYRNSNSDTLISGNSYFANSVTLQSSVYVSNGALYPALYFTPKITSLSTWKSMGDIYYNIGSTEKYAGGNFIFRLWSYDSDATTPTRLTTYVDYRFPSITADLETSYSRYIALSTSPITLYARTTNVNGTNWNMAGTSSGAAFTIFAPTTAGTAGQVLVSSGSGAPTWGSSSNLVAGSLNTIQLTKSDYSPSLSASLWIEVIDDNTKLSSVDAGTYAIQVTSGSNFLASGVFSVYKGITDSASDEIPLHIYTSKTTRIYLRTNGTKLLIASNDKSSTQWTNVVIKIAKIL